MPQNKRMGMINVAAIDNPRYVIILGPPISATTRVEAYIPTRSIIAIMARILLILFILCILSFASLLFLCGYIGRLFKIIA